MSDGGRRAVPRVGQVGMREVLFLKNKLREGQALMEQLLVENQHLRNDNQYLRRVLWAEMTKESEKKEQEDVEMDEAMEDILLLS
jgi:regulator of replication initiation timing